MFVGKIDIARFRLHKIKHTEIILISLHNYLFFADYATLGI